MTTLKTLKVALGLDKSAYDSGLDAAAKKASSSAKDIGKSLGEIGDKVTGVGEKMSVGLTLPIVGGFAKAISFASDLNETVNQVQVVFGDQADTIMQYSKGAAEAIGQSQQQALEAASTFALFGQSANLQGPDLADFSTRLTTLSSDFASFYNTSPDEAIQAIGAALRGETEPIRKYHVMLDDATIKQEALKLGLIATTTEALTPQTKILATYNAILDKSTVAQGDFGNTSGGLANSSRILTAEIADTASHTGGFLLPTWLKAIDLGKSLLGRFNALSPSTQQLIVVVLALVAGMGPLLIIVGQVISAIGAILPVAAAVGAVLSGPLLLVIGAVVAALALLALAWTNDWGGIREKTQAFFDWIKPFVDNALKGVSMVFDAFSLAFSGDWEGFGKKLRELWDLAWEAIKTSFSSAWDSLLNLDWGELGRNIVSGIANGIIGAADLIAAAARGVGSAALSAIKGFLGISSPSKIFEQQVGFQMGEGVRVGWQRSLNSLRSGMASDMQPAVAAAGSVSGGGAASGVSPVINIYFSSLISTADEWEAQQKLEPFIREAYRKIVAYGEVRHG